MYTAEFKPQVSCTVGNLTTVGVNITSAEYEFKTAPYQITAISSSGANKCTPGGTLTFTASGLPALSDNPVYTVYACGSSCSVASSGVTATSVACTLPANLMGGKWNTRVFVRGTAFVSGEVPWANGVTRLYDVTPTMTAMVEYGKNTLTFNKLGGQMLKITGTNFPPVYPLIQVPGAKSGNTINADYVLTSSLAYTPVLNIYDGATAYTVCDTLQFSSDQTYFTCTSQAVTAPASPTTAAQFNICFKTTWSSTVNTVCSAAFTGVTFQTSAN